MRLLENSRNMHLGDRIMALVVMAAVVFVFLMLGIVGVICWLGDLALTQIKTFFKSIERKTK